MTSIKSRLAKGTIWISGSRALTNLLAFVATLVLGRTLSPADFGIIAMATAVLAVLTAATEISLTEALVQHKSPTSTHFSTAWTFSCLRSLFVGLVFAAVAAPLSSFYGEPRLLPVCLTLAVGVAFTGFTNPRVIMLTKDLVFWQQFVMQLSDKLTSLIVSVSIALIFKTYWALVAGTVAGQIASIVTSYLVLPYRPSLSFRHGRELFSFSIWLTLGQAISTINWKFDQLLVGFYLGKFDLGFYTVGSNLAIIPSREVTAPLTITLFPAFVAKSGDPMQLRRAYQRAQAVVTAVALPVGVGVAFIAEPLVRLTMGDKWRPAILVIQALSAIFALQTLGSLAQPIAMAKGMTSRLFQRDLQSFCMRLPLLAISMYFYGLIGIVAARVVTGIIAIFFNMRVISDATGLKIGEQLGANKRSLISVTVMAITLVAFKLRMGPATSTVGLLLQGGANVVAGAIIYPTCHIMLWILTGKQQGPEIEGLVLLKSIGRKFNRRASASDGKSSQ